MKQTAISFNPVLVPQIMNGSKVMTRRPMKPQPTDDDIDHVPDWSDVIPGCPYGQLGDLLWVKETHYVNGIWEKNGTTSTGRQKYKFRELSSLVLYDDTLGDTRVCTKRTEVGYFKRNSRFMPKRYARLWLKVTGIGVERLNEISEQDAIKEGVKRLSDEHFKTPHYLDYTCTMFSHESPVRSFQSLIEYIYGDGAFDSRWVWVVSFTKEA